VPGARLHGICVPAQLQEKSWREEFTQAATRIAQEATEKT